MTLCAIAVFLAFVAGIAIGSMYRAAPKWLHIDTGDRLRSSTEESLFRGLVMEDGIYLFTIDQCAVARSRGEQFFPAEIT